MTDVLVVRRGGLGDTLLMTPLLRALRRLRPGHGMHFAGVREFAEILLQHGVVDRVLSSEDLALWSLGSGRVAARERLSRYAHIVSDDPSILALANAETTVQAFDPRPRTAEPIARQLAGQLGLELVWPEDAWLLPARSGAVDGPVMLAPGSGSRDKCWPRVRWLELAQRLVLAGERVQVVVGPAEIERDDPRQWSWPAVAFVVEREPAMLARRLAEASAFVGNDSGPSHLAAMLAVPTVAIFGPTVASIWAPVGPHVTVAGGEGRDLAGIDVAEILDALQLHGSRARTFCQ